MVTNDDELLYYIIQLYHKSAGIKYEDMFVLAPSCRNEKSPVRKLANKLSDEGINIYVPHSDNEVFDEDLIKGKLVFSTFHQETQRNYAGQPVHCWHRLHAELLVASASHKIERPRDQSGHQTLRTCHIRALHTPRNN